MITANSLVAGFANHIILDNVSMQLEDGAMVVLSGPSGSGKTTLLRILAGLDVPQSGSVCIDGEIATENNYCLEPHRRNIGFAFQSPSLWPHMTITENVEFAITHGTRQVRKKRLKTVLDQVGITDLASRYPSEVSFGQAQRAALARAIAPQPKHLFLDEPFTNLDHQTRSLLLELVKKQNMAHQIAVLFVTHEPEEIKQLGGNRLHIMDGKLTCPTEA